MSLDQIRTFVAVAEEGSVSKAALRLHATQPPLSRQICALEEELGAALFVRAARGMSLSTHGRMFLPHARRILDDVERALAAMQSQRAPHEHDVQQSAEANKGQKDRAVTTR